jgi:hypothetical protein|tara:strand:- start:5195 stop:5545 length:351 start_codon:yes stop_codon:yes gene_type:complete
MKYELHQIHYSDAEIDKVNAEGHDSVDKNKLHIDMTVRRNQIELLAKEAWNKGYYTHVSNIETDQGLDGVFQIGNIGSEEHIERLAPMYSTSVGDIIIDNKGKKFVVASLGFKEVA